MSLGFRHSFLAKWCLHAQWEEVEGTIVLAQGTAYAKSLMLEGAGMARALEEAGPLSCSRKLKGNFGQRNDRGSDDRKPLALLWIFQDFLLCNLPPTQTFPSWMS